MRAFNVIVKIHRDIFSLWQPLQKGAAEKTAMGSHVNNIQNDIGVVTNVLENRKKEYIIAHIRMAHTELNKMLC